MLKLTYSRTARLGVALAFAALASTPLLAGEVTHKSHKKEVIKTEEEKPRFTIYGWIQGGATWNFDGPDDNQNFGRLFDDRSNEFLLNQVVITAERVLAPKPGEFDWGFKLQAMYGSDARFIHSLGLLDDVTDDRMQPDLVEAYINLHAPFFTEGGIDLKIGKFVTLEGLETIDPRTNFFYSHSYIFNFGIPFNHTGALATWHVNPNLDLMAGITRGVNASIEDNNDAWSFHGGFSLLNLADKVTIAASTHIGAETPDNDSDLRYLNAVTTTIKFTDKLTSYTDMNYAYDSAAEAKGYGMAQYLTYAFSDTFSAGIRAEVWRDEQGFYVAQFGANNDLIYAQKGEFDRLSSRTVGGGRTTYGAVTVGVNFKPKVPKPLAGLTIRPEIRYDRSLNGTSPFNDSQDKDMLTAGIDVLLTF